MFQNRADDKEDAALLARYVAGRSQAAFESLVARHAGWVHALARRHVRDEHLAHDVAQAVFLLLAQRAATIRDGRRVAAWLFRATTFAARHAIRGEARRRRRERVAARSELDERSSTTFDDASARYAALDEAVARLNATDREVISRRFYQGQSLADVGRAIGVSADAARKRVDRSLTRLRHRLTTAGEIELPALLAPLAALSRASGPPPVQSLTETALHPSQAAAARPVSIARGTLHMMIKAKIKAAATVALCLLVLGTGVLLAGESGWPSPATRKTTAPAQSTAAPVAATAVPTTSRMIMSKGLIIAAPPDGTQLVGLSFQTGAVARVDGEGFAVDDHVIISDAVGVYVGPSGVYAFSADTGTWAKAELPADAKVSLKSGIVTPHVVTLTLPGAVLAYSGTTGTWAKLDLAPATLANPAVAPDMAWVEADGHLYVFAIKTGKWTTMY